MNWLKLSPIYFFISFMLLSVSVFSIVKYGFNLSIEFTGGTVTTPQGFEYVGPSIGQETIRKTIISIVLAVATLLIYISFTFKKLKFGVCAIMATLHDSLILLGSFSLLGHFFNLQVDLLFVTAVLTTLSFSVHDTIVVFDRIRELSKLTGTVLVTNEKSTINQAITDTIVRSLNNSLTIIFMLLALLLMGAESTKPFILALLIGTIIGTYSSTFTAAPLLIIWTKLFPKR
ncbi:protein translocase subunit SecF [Patescibacteria group bacterium]|nr:protein translocase subunit SecF [Patescibacteria group bacterium]